MRVDNEHAAGVVFSTKRALWECVDWRQPNHASGRKLGVVTAQ